LSFLVHDSPTRYHALFHEEAGVRTAVTELGLI
jgi:hypothetical protein